MDGFPGPPADVSQLEATMLAVEHACSLIQMHVNPQEAEQVLVLLRKSSMPYQSCQYILGIAFNTQQKHANAEDAYVQSKVSASAAQLMKRGWIEFAESEKSLVLSQPKD
ncbi:hypothetical protein HPP92_025352 [Vanilla planifolia]|uniref:Uncharacterized protein n=1 Tax=Vanilla planifolia TaxID=51239 RepID=A0A835PJY0_VANPL|nr:hypothetical protein HPP92_025352 [Vanilla planifolia]